jgi:hypothetical protein
MNGVGTMGTNITLLGGFRKSTSAALNLRHYLCAIESDSTISAFAGADLMAAVTADAERSSPPLLSKASVAMRLNMSAVEQQFGRWLALVG